MTLHGVVRIGEGLVLDPPHGLVVADVNVVEGVDGAKSSRKTLDLLITRGKVEMTGWSVSLESDLAIEERCLDDLATGRHSGSKGRLIDECHLQTRADSFHLIMSSRCIADVAEAHHVGGARRVLVTHDLG